MSRTHDFRMPGQQRFRTPRPHRADSYQGTTKKADSMVCDACDVVYHGGRWYWGAPPFGEVRGGLCPACQRARDGYPAGTIRLTPAMTAHEDLVPMMRHLERSEVAEHPLERILTIEMRREGMLVTTTGLHIARRIVTHLERRFHARARVHYDETHTLHVDWAR